MLSKFKMEKIEKKNIYLMNYLKFQILHKIIMIISNYNNKFLNKF